MKKLLLCFVALLLMVGFSKAINVKKPAPANAIKWKALFNSNITLNNVTSGYRNSTDWYCNIWDETLGMAIYSGEFPTSSSNIYIDDNDVCDISVVYVGSGTVPSNTYLTVYSNAYGQIGSSSGSTSAYIPGITFSGGDSFNIYLDAN